MMFPELFLQKKTTALPRIWKLMSFMELKIQTLTENLRTHSGATTGKKTPALHLATKIMELMRRQICHQRFAQATTIKAMLTAANPLPSASNMLLSVVTMQLALRAKFIRKMWLSLRILAHPLTSFSTECRFAA
ncbi:hypothetical protein AWI07_13390 [Enterobacter roggenkampii]|nr:hypothetical protein AWI07_13390 [Enterobacter roggenkampii]